MEFKKTFTNYHDKEELSFDIVIDDVFFENRYLLGLVNDFEEYDWSLEKVIDFINIYISETALTMTEKESLINKGKMNLILKESYKNIRIDKYMAEIGEIFLYGILKEYYSAIPLNPKIYYKQNSNDYAKGFDSVHITLDDNNLLLWLGESKFYSNIDNAIDEACKSLKEHINKKIIKKEFELSYDSKNFNIIKSKHLDESNAEELENILNKTKKLEYVKNKLHVPIMIMYECHITKKYKELSEQYVEELKKFFIQKGNIFLSELNDSIMDYYKCIHFHLFLFPVVNINSIREKFKDIILPYHQLHNINNEVKKIDLFKECSIINNLLKQNKEEKAREQLITLLNIIKDKNVEINFEPENTIKFFTHLIRMTGLYPYLKKYIENSSFEDQLIYNLFSLDHEKDINGDIVLHREQSKVLKLLLEGKNILLSAPTSFGKSYIIDSLISMKKPKNILIIVPTIALLDETRRRIYKKFHNDYNIITTANESIYFKNIFIFTQERALTYYKVLSNINVDLLIVDEFYKIGLIKDNNGKCDVRSSILQQVIFYYCSKITQKYFITPNIDEVSENPFIEHNEFYYTDFNTVKVEEHDYVVKGNNKKYSKNNKLNLLLRNELFNKKNIIYTNTVVGIKNNIYIRCIEKYNINIFTNTVLLNNFLKWLEQYYSKEWILYKLIKRGIGIHNAQIPKCLSQIQIRLFNDKEIGHINTIIATSSLIEGVNTVAENIVLYSNKIASDIFDRFTYNNIKGRAGRMFEYYTGHIYLLEKPPDKKRYKLNIDINDSTIIDIDNTEISNNLTEEQKNNIEETKKEMILMIGEEEFYTIRDENSIKNDRETMLNITKKLYDASENNELIDMLLPFSNDDWKNDYKYILNILHKYPNSLKEKDIFNMSQFVIDISSSWYSKSLEILNTTKNYIGIDDYFRFENLVSFDVYNLFSDINILQKCILKDNAIDISKFVNNLQNVFLPPHVYTLEEFGLPRMLSKTIDESGIIKFNFDEKDGINKTLNKFIEKKDDIIKLFDVNSFDYYFLQYFYDGIDIKI